MTFIKCGLGKMNQKRPKGGAIIVITNQNACNHQTCYLKVKPITYYIYRHWSLSCQHSSSFQTTKRKNKHPAASSPRPPTLPSVAKSQSAMGVRAGAASGAQASTPPNLKYNCSRFLSWTPSNAH